MNMENPKRYYKIFSLASSSDLGIYRAASEEDAIKAMADDAGYRSVADMLDVLDMTMDTFRATIIINTIRIAP
jgi:hypothetical protein